MATTSVAVGGAGVNVAVGGTGVSVGVGVASGGAGVGCGSSGESSVGASVGGCGTGVRVGTVWRCGFWPGAAQVTLASPTMISAVRISNQVVCPRLPIKDLPSILVDNTGSVASGLCPTATGRLSLSHVALWAPGRRRWIVPPLAKQW